MVTPAKLAANRHRALVAEARMLNEELQGNLDDLAKEVRVQSRQARPTMAGVATLCMDMTRNMARQQRILNEMHELIAKAVPADWQKLVNRLAEIEGRLKELEEGGEEEDE